MLIVDHGVGSAVYDQQRTLQLRHVRHIVEMGMHKSLDEAAISISHDFFDALERALHDEHSRLELTCKQ